MDATVLDFSIEVFPMMQTGAGYWWAVYDERGHIWKLGRADSKAEAQDAAEAYLRERGVA